MKEVEKFMIKPMEVIVANQPMEVEEEFDEQGDVEMQDEQ